MPTEQVQAIGSKSTPTDNYPIGHPADSPTAYAGHFYYADDRHSS